MAAYQAVGVPISRIFTINSKGEIKAAITDTFRSSYARGERRPGRVAG